MVAYGVALAAIASSAQAQSQDTSSPPSPQGATTVTVTAKTKPVKRNAEGVVYDESNNPKGRSGTAGDVLNTVPSVTVTPDGNVSLRGDSHVQIYIDGKPSALMRGDSRNLTLEAMPGSAIASVEVITNPSAKYDANGSGIINIVLKKSKKPGAYGTVTVNYGNEGRKNAALTWDVVGQRLALHTQFSAREDLQPKGETTTTDWIGAATGQSVQSSFVNAHRFSTLALIGFDYKISDADQLSLNLTSKKNRSANILDQYHQDFDSAGTLQDAYDRRSSGPRHQHDVASDLTFSHKGAAGDEFRLQAQVSQSLGTLDKSYINLFSYPITPDTGVHVLTRSSQHLAEVSGDGVMPVGAKSQLSYGFEVRATRDGFSNIDATLDPATGLSVVNPGLTNAFAVDQRIGAAYVTWQTEVKALTVLAGLRAEHTQTRVEAGSVTNRDVAGLIPTLHLTYALNDTRQVIASATSSYQRPDPRDLNPFTTYVDAQNVTSGNPDLKPQRVASFEAGYVKSHGDDTLSVTGYYKTTRHTVTDYSYFLPGDVLLTTKRNSGDGQTLGLEYVRTGKLAGKASYSLSGNLFDARLQAEDPGGRVLRSGISYTAKGTLDYALTDAEDISIETDVDGRTITAQGWQSGKVVTDLHWDRRFTDRVMIFVNINDVTNGAKVKTVRMTSTFTQVDETFIHGQQIFVGIRYRFGGGKG